ncbi:MAG: hypothetical protein ACREUT_09790 [Steroidobacteraceae bacterium]
MLAGHPQTHVTHAFSRIGKHVGTDYERLISNEHTDVRRTLHARLTRTLGEYTLLSPRDGGIERDRRGAAIIVQTVGRKYIVGAT